MTTQNLAPNNIPAAPVTPDVSFTQQEVKMSPSIYLKLGYLVMIIAVLGIGTVFFLKKYVFKTTAPTDKTTLAEFPYQSVLWRDFGEVFEPIVKIPLYYPNKGFQKEEFLLDSGAVVSSLTREKASELGFSLAKLPRSTFAGFGGTTSFAYKASIKILLGDKEITIPVVFTESAGTKSILGRSGFFENYSVYFNSKSDKIEIKI